MNFTIKIRYKIDVAANADELPSINSIKVVANVLSDKI